MSDRRKRKKTTASFSGVLDLFTIGIAVATLLGFLGRLHWIADLFSHFRVQYFQICLVLIAIALWRRWNRRALVLVVLISLNYALVLPFYFNRPKPTTDPTVRAMLMNLNAANGHADQVLTAVKNADPDILLLEELTGVWEQKLRELDSTYSYRIAAPQEDCFGIMLLSKHLLSQTNAVCFGSAGVPSVITDIRLPQGTVSFIGTHPLPPVSGAYSRHRNDQLDQLSTMVSRQKHPVLLMGDLNASPWSYHFNRLISESGLKDSMRGFGFQPSWPRKNRFMRIPIDHLLHSSEITIHYRAVGKDIGSDHFPLIVDFSL